MKKNFIQFEKWSSLASSVFLRPKCQVAFESLVNMEDIVLFFHKYILQICKAWSLYGIGDSSYTLPENYNGEMSLAAYISKVSIPERL